MDPYVPCAVGCTVWVDGVEYERPADVGALCSSCHVRIGARLAEAPGIVRELRANVAGLRAVDTTNPRVSGTREAPLPFDDGALEAADELFATVATWAVSHAATMRSAGSLPAWLGGLAAADVDPRRLPTVSTPQSASQHVSEVVDWLTLWGETIAHTIPAPSLKAYHDDIVDLIRRTRGRAGLSERPPRIRKSGYLCGVCGMDGGEADVPDIGPIVFRCVECHTVYPAFELAA